MSKIFTEASLSDSYIYQELNKSSRASTTIVNAIKTGAPVDSSFIEEQIIQCRRSKLSPLVETVLNAFDKGQIKLIYNKNVRVSTTLPFVVITIGGATSSYIFISDFSGLTKDQSSLNIEMKKLYTLMESAYIGLIFYTKPTSFQRSIALMKIMSNIYAGMCMRIFNKEFALSLDKGIYDKVNYSTARFFLERIAVIKNDALVNTYSIAACNNPNEMAMSMIEKEYGAAGITSVNELISMISGLSPKMKKLNFRYYFERWITTYGQGAAVAIDAFPYMYYVITNTLLGSFLVNVPTMSEIVKNTKNINLFYSEINKIV